VVREMYEAVAAAAQQYEASGPGPNPTPGVYCGWLALGWLGWLVVLLRACALALASPLIQPASLCNGLYCRQCIASVLTFMQAAA